MNPLLEFNRLLAKAAQKKLLSCCGSHGWAARVAELRPFADEAMLVQAAEAVWFALPEADWLEAFACHPRIGEREPATTASLASSENEQTAAQSTLDGVAEALLAGNRAYEQKFGFRYIVFASGRSAPELLQVLKRRLQGARAEELQEAALQQHRITTLRMQKWLQSL